MTTSSVAIFRLTCRTVALKDNLPDFGHDSSGAGQGVGGDLRIGASRRPVDLKHTGEGGISHVDHTAQDNAMLQRVAENATVTKLISVRLHGDHASVMAIIALG